MKQNPISKIVSIVVVFTLIAAGTNGFAQTATAVVKPSSIPELNSTADMLAYAFDNTRYIGVFANASSQITATTNDQTSVYLQYSPTNNGIADPAEIFAIVASQQLEFSVLYPLTDTVSMNAELNDSDGWNMLFASPPGAAIGNSSPIVTNVFNLQFQLPTFVTITVPGNITSAFIEQHDANGNIIGYYYLNTYPGYPGGTKIQIPAYYLGKNADLTLGFSDNTQTAYGFNNGGQQKPVTKTVAKAGIVSAQGIYQVPNNTNAVYIAVTANDFNSNVAPLVPYNIFGDNGQTTYFASWLPGQNGIPSEYAVSVSIWRRGTSSSTAVTVPAPSGQLTIPVNLSPGSYWVKYHFKSGYGETVNQFGQPYNYETTDGKG